LCMERRKEKEKEKERDDNARELHLEDLESQLGKLGKLKPI